MDDKKAFPRQPGEDGMSMRDYFAAKAMAAMLTFEQNLFLTFGSKDEQLKIAKSAYSHTDAMMEARK